MAIQAGKAKFTDTGIYDLPLKCNVPSSPPCRAMLSAPAGRWGCSATDAVFSEESIYLSPYLKYGFTPGAGATLIFPQREFGNDLGHEDLFSAREYKAATRGSAGMSPVVPRAEVDLPENRRALATCWRASCAT